MANLRAAKAEAVAGYLTGDLTAGTQYYETTTGKIVASATANTKGKGTANSGNNYTGTDNEYGYVSTTDYTNQDITIVYTKGASGTSDTLTVSLGAATTNTANLADSSTVGAGS